MASFKSARNFRLVASLACFVLVLGCVLLIRPAASGLNDKEPIPSVDPTRALKAVFPIVPGQTLGPSYIASLTDAELDAILSQPWIGLLETTQAKTIGSALVSRALIEERQPEEYISSVFPSASETLAMLARDRDVDDYLENASEKGPAGLYYQSVADLVPSMKPLRNIYEHLFEGALSALGDMGRTKVPVQTYPDAALYEGGVTLPRLSSKPKERDYDYSHTFALDIFLKEVAMMPFSGLEKGPVIFSLTDSIVVATDSTWRGGEELSSYHSGGITPKAGNGVILYSPEKRKYYLYFHLYDVLVSPGEAIPAGFPLGHGGNTGTNARKSGHGEHLHLEIYDAKSARFLRNDEIADIVF